MIRNISGKTRGYRRRRTAKLLLLVALVGGTMALVVPATASADARVWTQIPCLSYADAGATKYEGTGTYLETETGDVVIACHMTLAYGTTVSAPTRTTYGNCELLRLPSGEAELSCRYALI